MELWIPITLAAAFMQNLRFMLQKHLKSTGLSTSGATFARFVFAAPLAGLVFGGLLVFDRNGVAAPNLRFAAFALTGGLGQILATLCVVALFGERNFTVGITFKKTEMVQTAIIGMAVLGETISGGGMVAIGIGLGGIILLSDPPVHDAKSRWHQRLFNRASGFGLASGALFGVAAVGYRGATLALSHGDVLIRAALTLAFVTIFQSCIMAVFLVVREPGQIGKVIGSWRVTGLVGLTGMLGSLGWFTAFALQNAAYVKALGQVELVFTFLASYFYFKERGTARELLGIALVVVSILVLIMYL